MLYLKCFDIINITMKIEDIKVPLDSKKIESAVQNEEPIEIIRMSQSMMASRASRRICERSSNSFFDCL